MIGTGEWMSATGRLDEPWVVSLRYHRRRRPEPHLENFLESFAPAARYMRYTPGVQVILTRDFLFGLYIAAVPALVPVVALVLVLMAMVPNLWMFLPVTALAGISWTVSASELWIAGQRAMPDWARVRMNAVHLMALARWGGARRSLLGWGSDVRAVTTSRFRYIGRCKDRNGPTSHAQVNQRQRSLPGSQVFRSPYQKC